VLAARDTLSRPTLRRAQAPVSGRAIPALVHTHPDETVLEAIGIMAEYAVSQLVVLGAEPPVMMGEVTGAVDEKRLLDLLFRGDAQPTDPHRKSPRLNSSHVKNSYAVVRL